MLTKEWLNAITSVVLNVAGDRSSLHQKYELRKLFLLPRGFQCCRCPFVGAIQRTTLSRQASTVTLVVSSSPLASSTTLTMADASAKRKLRPARKQVKPGDVDLSEKVQAGKEYSECRHGVDGGLSRLHADGRYLVQQVGRRRQGGRALPVSIAGRGSGEIKADDEAGGWDSGGYNASRSLYYLDSCRLPLVCDLIFSPEFCF